MAARCASCSYPLSVSDSVVCYECSSYFHIDCAQLVGFPHYVLSSDPSRNTFRCTTCVLLPLPTRECDSDSDSDCDMPSRQQDYPLDAQADIAKDMNEVKGAVQDLSNLCKDMLREINDIKSINLTLRCGIENLRHENEERDQVIADLKHRLDNFENIKGTVDNTVKCTVCKNVLEQNTEDSLVLDDIRAKDKYITTRPTAYEETGTVEETFRDLEEVIKSKVNSFVTEERKENRQDWTWKGRKAVELEESAEESVEEEGITEGSEVEEETAHGWETLQEELESEYKIKEEVVYTAIKVNVESSNTISDEEILNSEYETETEDESLIEKEPQTGEEKYSDKDDNSEPEAKSFLRASGKIKQEPIEEEESDDYQREEYSFEHKNTFQEERDVEDRENTETTHNENRNSDTITQEKASSVECSLNYLEDKLSGSEVELSQHEAESINSNENYYENKTTEPLQLKTKPALYDSGEEEEEEDINEDETHSKLEDIRQDDFIEVEVGEIPEEGDNEESLLRDEEKEDVDNTEGVEDEYRSELDDIIDNKEEVCEEDEEGLHLIEEQTLEGRPDGDERLGESHLDVPEGETGVEDEQRLGGQSLEDGEVQPSEPPPTPPPQHTEEDLWHYLKEAVTSEHPSTVEEFLQNLIGTLQHVPEEYLQPVIEANIKRATSPTISTDGEPLRTLEEPMEKREAVTVEGTQVSEGDAVPEETAAVDEVSPEASSQFTEESPSGDADGYSAVEAAA